MNITEANAANALIRYAFGLEGAPSVGDVREHAELLADRAHSALAAGVTSEDVRKAIDLIGGDSAATILALIREKPQSTADLITAAKRSRSAVWRATVALRDRGEIYVDEGDSLWHATPERRPTPSTTRTTRTTSTSTRTTTR